MRKTMTVVDLFAGVGGFTLGFLRANTRSVDFEFGPRLLVDIDPTAAYTFKKNFPQIPFWPTDLSKVNGSDILNLIKVLPNELDFLIGGPPCQGFSINGRRWLEDRRNELLSRFIDIAHQLSPKCVIMENVPLALSAWQKLFSEEIQEAFSGYIVKAAVLNSSEFGVPQIRKRAFIVAIRSDLGVADFDFPKGSFDALDVGNDSHHEAKSHLRFVSVEDAIGDLPPLNPGESIDGVSYTIKSASDYQSARRVGSIGVFNHVARSHSKEFLQKISPIEPGQGNFDLPDDKRFSDNYYSQAYARLHPKGIGFTITAHFRNPGSGRFTHYRDNRSITVREAARLQSFDDKFIFHGNITDQERHVGNAVPPLLAESLALHFGSIISKTTTLLSPLTAWPIKADKHHYNLDIYKKRKLPALARIHAIDGDSHPNGNNSVYSIEEAVSTLTKNDVVLGRVIEAIGPCEVNIEMTRSTFEALLKAIVYQQLSGKAAAAIYARVEELLKGKQSILPRTVINMPEERLREVGLSWAKISAIKDLAAKTINGTVPPIGQLQRMQDEDIIKRLCLIRGVGSWTVEMLLIFRLGRPDVLPVSDHSIRKAFSLIYKLKRLPSNKELLQRGENWRPFRTIASWYLWRALELPNLIDE